MLLTRMCTGYLAHSAATEAVGYGKALMGYHALRIHIGDQLERSALRLRQRGDGRAVVLAVGRLAFALIDPDDVIVLRVRAQIIKWCGVIGQVVASEGLAIQGDFHER